MTAEEMRVACAEALNWHIQYGPVVGGASLHDGQGCLVESFWLNGKTKVTVADRLNSLPDWPADLDAMHQAEQQTFIATSQWAKYGNQLQEVTRWHCVGIVPDYNRDLASLARLAHATAFQRCTAFLKAVGRWPTGEGKTK